MQNVVQVQEKNVYGQLKLYPFNDQAIKLAAFKGNKTLSDDDVSCLKNMGFKVELVTVRGSQVVHQFAL